MTVLSKTEKLCSLVLNPQIFTCHVKYVFIISHMRSRSSVLSHVLGSNSEICGYGESFRSYSDWIDLLKMRINLFLDLKEDVQDKYLLDKLLHNHLQISNGVIKTIKPKIIFLLREPESSIKSIIKMANQVEIKSLMEPEAVLEYYCSRLTEMEKIARGLNESFFFIESDDLINNTDIILDRLTMWLGLDEPLKSTYSIFNNTGKPGVGDPSRNIQAGIIQKTKSHSDLVVSSDIVHAGQLAYETCKLTLLKHSASPST